MNKPPRFLISVLVGIAFAGLLFIVLPPTEEYPIKAQWILVSIAGGCTGALAYFIFKN